MKTEAMLTVEGMVTMEHFRGGKCIYRERGKNIIPTAGMNHILDVVLGATAKSTNWYVGLFKGNVTPVAGDTAAAALGTGGGYTECLDADYTPATNRPAFTPAASSGGIITNDASKATFTIVPAGPTTIYGACLVNVATKTSNTGTLIAAKRFTTSRSVVTGDIIYVTYQITCTSA